jgi:hypothetical protein
LPRSPRSTSQSCQSPSLSPGCISRHRFFCSRRLFRRPRLRCSDMGRLARGGVGGSASFMGLLAAAAVCLFASVVRASEFWIVIAAVLRLGWWINKRRKVYSCMRSVCFRRRARLFAIVVRASEFWIVIAAAWWWVSEWSRMYSRTRGIRFLAFRACRRNFRVSLCVLGLLASIFRSSSSPRSIAKSTWLLDI